METHRKLCDLGMQLGHQRRTKEILTWVKKRKRPHVRRDELIAFLCGKSKPNRATQSWPSTQRRVADGSAAAAGATPHHNITLTCLSLTDPPTTDPTNGDLQTFRDALSGE